MKKYLVTLLAVMFVLIVGSSCVVSAEELSTKGDLRIKSVESADREDRKTLEELRALKVELAERLSIKTKKETRWTGDMTVGVNLQSGNTNSSALSLSGKASKRVDSERYTVKGAFNYSEENDTLTARNGRRPSHRGVD